MYQFLRTILYFYHSDMQQVQHSCASSVPDHLGELTLVRAAQVRKILPIASQALSRNRDSRGGGDVHQVQYVIHDICCCGNCRKTYMRMGERTMAPMQNISGNNDGTYTSFMSPCTAGMLGLSCRPCSGPQQLKFGDYKLVVAILGVLVMAHLHLRHCPIY